jgi:hypothetical protein
MGAGYPALSKDVRRRLGQATARIVADRASAVIRFDTAPGALDALRDEITSACEDRNLDAGRPVLRAPWARLYTRADEVATLRIDGKLAAWDLAAYGPVSYRVLAGQMVSGFKRYSPGRLLEAALLARVLTDPRWAWIDWGPGHPEALITARAT